MYKTSGEQYAIGVTHSFPHQLPQASTALYGTSSLSLCQYKPTRVLCIVTANGYSTNLLHSTIQPLDTLRRLPKLKATLNSTLAQFDQKSKKIFAYFLVELTGAECVRRRPTIDVFTSCVKSVNDREFTRPNNQRPSALRLQVNLFPISLLTLYFHGNFHTEPW